MADFEEQQNLLEDDESSSGERGSASGADRQMSAICDPSRALHRVVVLTFMCFLGFGKRETPSLNRFDWEGFWIAAGRTDLLFDNVRIQCKQKSLIVVLVDSFEFVFIFQEVIFVMTIQPPFKPKSSRQVEEVKLFCITTNNDHI